METITEDKPGSSSQSQFQALINQRINPSQQKVSPAPKKSKSPNLVKATSNTPGYMVNDDKKSRPKSSGLLLSSS